jgi:RNA polymerase sigma-70 factor (ECF subfamily)
MPLDPAVEKAMLAAIPDLHGFAISLCRRADRADDLVQEALLHAIDKIESFTPGTNIAAWLCTILRNNFCNDFRRRRREVPDSDYSFIGTMTAQPAQESRMRFAEFRIALAKLPHDQREAVLLVGASGLSYDEAAEICRCPVGTIKSRTNRGRIKLAEMLSVDTAEDLGPDKATQAALSGGNLHWAA